MVVYPHSGMVPSSQEETIAIEKTVQMDLANIRLIKKGQIERTHCTIQLQGRELKTKDQNKGYLGGR